MKVKISRSEKKIKYYGKVSRITFPDRSQIYITKRGWTIATDKRKIKRDIMKMIKWGRIELTIPYSELNVAIRETVIAGYKNGK